MSKGQRGNKEVKKPTKTPVPAQPLAPASRTLTQTAAVPPRAKR